MEKKLIDVSKHQGIIDWAKVKASGIDGAIIRCGYGDNITSQDDSKFRTNVEGCVANGIPFGVYIYSYAKTNEQAKSEAEHVLRLLAPYANKMQYPVYLDLEAAGTEQGAVERANIFGDIIEGAGYWCGVYANEYWWTNHLKGLERCYLRYVILCIFMIIQKLQRELFVNIRMIYRYIRMSIGMKRIY